MVTLRVRELGKGREQRVRFWQPQKPTKVKGQGESSEGKKGTGNPIYTRMD